MNSRENNYLRPRSVSCSSPSSLPHSRTCCPHKGKRPQNVISCHFLLVSSGEEQKGWDGDSYMALTLIFLSPKGPSENRDEGEESRRREEEVGKLDRRELSKGNSASAACQSQLTPVCSLPGTRPSSSPKARPCS